MATELEKQLAEALRAAIRDIDYGNTTDPDDLRVWAATLAAFDAQQAAPFGDSSAMVGTRSAGIPGVTVYDLGPSRNPDSAISRKLLEMGWRPPAADAVSAQQVAASEQPAASVALTDEQIDEIMRACHLSAIEAKDYRAQRFSGMTWDEREDYGRALRFARAIEAAHGIKPLNALVTAPDPAQQEQR